MRPTTEFELRFARYDPKTGESRISSTMFTQAEDIRGAQTIAEAVLTGLNTDTARKYRIIQIKERGTRGLDCSGGGVAMFETAEEFSARIQQEKGK